MRSVHLPSVDLNLLVSLESLLRTRSVTLTATEVGLSQPAMSRTLGRLRELFDDPLLLRAGQAMAPTPRGLSLQEPLRSLLDAIQRTLEPPGEFDSGISKRAFTVSSVDTTQAVLLPRLLDRLRTSAPGIEVTTTPLHSTEQVLAQLASGERDLAAGRFESPPDGIRSERLYSDRIICLVRQKHPRIRGKLTMKRYLAEDHLGQEVFSALERPFTIESLLAAKGLSRRVVCAMENIAMAPFVVARSDLICTAPRQTIRPFAHGLGLRILEPPFHAPDFDIQLIWHQRNDQDAGHVWLRNMILGLFEGSIQA